MRTLTYWIEPMTCEDAYGFGGDEIASYCVMEREVRHVVTHDEMTIEEIGTFDTKPEAEAFLIAVQG